MDDAVVVKLILKRIVLATEKADYLRKQIMTDMRSSEIKSVSSKSYDIRQHVALNERGICMAPAIFTAFEAIFCLGFYEMCKRKIEGKKEGAKERKNEGINKRIKK